MDPGDLKRLFDGQRRQDGRYALREHRLAAPRSAYHHQVVPSRDGNLYRLLREVLPLHVYEIVPRIPRRKHETGEIGEHGADIRPSLQKLNGLAERPYRIYRYPIHHCGLVGILDRDNHPALAYPAHLHDDRQYATNTPHLAGKRKLPDKAPLRKIGASHLVRRRKQAYRDGEIVYRPLLAHVRRREIHGDVRFRTLEARIRYRRGDPILRFLDRSVRKPHDGELRRTI